MKRFLRIYKNLKLRTKLVLSFMIAVIIPLIMLGTYLTNELRTNALNDAIEQSAANIERVKLRTAETLETSIEISNELTLDNELINIVTTEYNSLFSVVESYSNYDRFDEYLYRYKEISNIRIYTNNQTILNNWEIIPVNPQEKPPDWYQNALENRGNINWYYMEDETRNNDKYLSLVRNLNYTKKGKTAVLVIDINTDHLIEIINQEQSPIMIVDNQNNIIVSNREEFIGSKFEGIATVKEKNKGETGTYTGEFNGQEAGIIIDLLLPETSQTALKFVSLIPQDYILKDANQFVKQGLLVMFFSILIALFLILFFSKLFSKRILSLGSQINTVAEGNIDADIFVEGNDEIGELSRQINDMKDSIKELINEVEKVHIEKNILEKRQQEIKLKMMASQINPHFLFNALESIRMKALIKGETEVSKVVKMLGKLMRYSISVTGEMVTLKSELEFVQYYLDIQKFRYEDRLQYEIVSAPSAENIYIHPLIIQPLVENAIIHGIENIEKDGKVIIITNVIGHLLEVKIIDNGVGIHPERLTILKQELNNITDRRENRIGLLNVQQRLKLTFGEDSGLVIESKPNIGTTVSFVIPIRERSAD